MQRSTLTLCILFALQQVQANTNDDINTLKTIIVQADEEDEEDESIIVSKQYIENSHTLADALIHIAGVQSSSFGPHSGAPVIRSQNGNRVSILENGQSVYGMNAISGNISIPFDPLFSESIRVQKSSDTVRYGGNAIGGSVDIDSGLISKKMAEKDHSVSIAFKKGFNRANAQGFKANFNNQKNLSTNIQFSTQKMSSYKIPGYSKASICDEDSLAFPVNAAGQGTSSILSSRCQRDIRIEKAYQTAAQPYFNDAVLALIGQNASNFFDYYDGLEEFKYSDNSTSIKIDDKKEFVNTPNPDYVPGTSEYILKKINQDVTPNYYKKMGNSHSKNENMAIGTTYFLDNGYIRLSLDHKTSHYGVPGFSLENKSFQSSYQDGLPVSVQSKQNRYALDVLVNQPIPFFDTIEFKASKLQNTSGEYIGGKNSNQYNFDSQFSELVLGHLPFQMLRGELGFNLNHRKVNGTGVQRYLPNVRTETKAIFLNEKLSFDRIYFNAGYRFEQVDHELLDDTFKISRNSNGSKQVNKHYDLNSYTVDFGAQITDILEFKTKYSRSERAPEINELYSSNPHFSIMTQLEGDTHLKKEALKSLEFIAQVDLDHTQIKANLYKLDYKDRMYEASSNFAVTNYAGLSYWKQDDTQINGFELSINQQFPLNQYGIIEVGAFADLVKQKFKNTSKIDTHKFYYEMPTNRYGANLNWIYGSWNANLSNIYYDATKSQDDQHISKINIFPAYNLLDLSINKKMSFKNAAFDFAIHGSNLLNEDIRPLNSPLRYIAPLAGRGVILSITMHL